MQTRTHIVAFLLALLVAGIGTPLMRRLSRRWGLYDSPDTKRKLHMRPISRLGGVAIAMGFFTPLVGLLIYNNDISQMFTSSPRHVVGLFIGGIAILMVGVWDDIRGMRARTKLFWQIVVSIGMLSAGFEINRIGIPLYGLVSFNYTVTALITVIWFVTIMNAVNLIDGLDGLAGGVAFFAVMTMYVVASMDPTPNVLTTLFAVTLAGAVVGFLFYNFNPATIFMGDCGSLFLGFIIASVAVQTHAKSSTAVALIVCALALGLPLLDTMLSVLRRLKRGRRVFDADRGHIHHRLLALGLSPRQVIFILYGICGLMAVFALMMKVESESRPKQGLILLVLVVVVVGLGQIFRVRERLYQQRLFDRSSDDLALPEGARISIREIVHRIRNTEKTTQVWEELREAAVILGVRDMKLSLYLRSRTEERIQQEYAYHHDDEVFSRLPHTTECIPLTGRKLWYGDLVFTFRTTRGNDEVERRFLAHLLSESVVEHIENHLLGQRQGQFVVRRMTERDENTG